MLVSAVSKVIELYTYICILFHILFHYILENLAGRTNIGFVFVFCLFRATSTAYGGSHARGQIGAVCANLHQSLSNAGSEPCLQPTPQLTAMPDP